MPLSWIEITNRAFEFSKKYENAKDEFAEAQSFLNDFFYVFGVDRRRVATFETKVPMGQNRSGYIDLLWPNVILVEMKSFGKSLDKAFEQAKDYSFRITNDSDLPKYILVSDFHRIRLYQLDSGQKWEFETKKLHTKIRLFADLAGYKASVIEQKDKEVDRKAAEKLAKLHDLLKCHGYTDHYLELYLVRILFCLFADDTGIFEKNTFYEYIRSSKKDGSDLADRISRLFEVLDTSPDIRDSKTLLSEDLKIFKYINGKLFNEIIPHADFDSKMRNMLLECCTLDWGSISPAIFGSIFQGVMNPEERRRFGAHYTSEDNILKVIRPLFLDELHSEFNRIKGNKAQLKQFHRKLSEMKFLDPACGCGNFLIVTYREIRLIEIEIMSLLDDGKIVRSFLDISNEFTINVDQFYGIEIEEFPCLIAQVGLWLVDHQMNVQLSEKFGYYYDRLPLKKSPTIILGNALLLEWESIVPKRDLHYIIGNPPFIGARLMSTNQKREIEDLWGDTKGVGNLDYVSGWYKKTADYIKDTPIKAALVSTNSITQGEQATLLWKPLFSNYKIGIDFAYRTFKWGNDAKSNAAVHCVIVGFCANATGKKVIFSEDGQAREARNINQYLVDSESIFVDSRTKPLSLVSEMVFGNMALDDGNFILDDQEREDIVSEFPFANEWIKPFIGSKEYINGLSRWCIWLENINPQEIQNCKPILDRIKRVREFRKNSKRQATVNLSNYPTLFAEIRQPDKPYILVPRVSSEKRKYIPLGFLDPNVIASDSTLMIPNADYYEFGILTSIVHMIWVNAVCGRLKSDYRYSKDIVYNNFPWPIVTEKLRGEISLAGKLIIDIRASYEGNSLASLYDPLIMPKKLLKSHEALDKLVLSAYGIKSGTSDDKVFIELLNRYKSLVETRK